MKKTLCFLFAIAAMTLVAEEVNLATPRDPGFEHGRRHWSISSPDYVSFEKNAGIDNTQALCIRSEDGKAIEGSASAYTCFIDVEPNQMYTISVKYKSKSVNGIFSMSLRTWGGYVPDASSQKTLFPTGDFSSEPAFGSTEDQWKTLSIGFTTPEKANAISYSLEVTGGFEGQVLFDDIRIVPVQQ